MKLNGKIIKKKNYKQELYYSRFKSWCIVVCYYEWYISYIYAFII